MYRKIIKAIIERIRAVLSRSKPEPVVTFRPEMPTSPCPVPIRKGKRCGVQGSILSTVDDRLQRICLKCACHSSVQHLIEELKLYELHKASILAKREAQQKDEAENPTIVLPTHRGNNPFYRGLRSSVTMSGAPDKKE